MPELAITGVGVTTALGQGKAAVLPALLDGRHAFGILRRPGRRAGGAVFPGAELGDVAVPADVPVRALRTASLTARAALATIDEAWHEAALDDVAGDRVGIVLGGSNIQQREQVALHDRYRDRAGHVRPSYGHTFLDTDVAALCGEHFGITGIAHTVGGASASGQLAVIEAARAVRDGTVDACVAVGALMDLSHWECQALRSLGAMAGDRYAATPQLACRPFDRDRDGFVYGEACAAIVVERLDRARVVPYATLDGWGYAVDGHRRPDPSLDGEIRAVEAALSAAGWSATDVDYVNPHGTGAVLGDDVELAALKACGLTGMPINTTKSLLGHGLTAAGAVELAVTVLQQRAGYLHPCRNLDAPVDDSFGWVRGGAVRHDARRALNLSFGFGGFNTAVCVTRYDQTRGGTR
jgi:malonyl-ACP decarboxylase